MRIKNAVPKDELIRFHFTQKEADRLVWLKKNEFRYKGGMYDVVRTNTLENSVVEYWCVSDHQETLLFARLDYFVRRDLNDGQRFPIKGLKILCQQPLEIPDFNVQISLFCTELTVRQYDTYRDEIHSGFAHLIIQPPQCALS